MDGLIFATVSGRIDDINEAGGAAKYATSFDSVGEFVSALLSPLAIALLAVGLRFAVAGLAFSLACLLTTWNRPTDYAHGRKR